MTDQSAVDACLQETDLGALAHVWCQSNRERLLDDFDDRAYRMAAAIMDEVRPRDWHKVADTPLRDIRIDHEQPFTGDWAFSRRGQESDLTAQMLADDEFLAEHAPGLLAAYLDYTQRLAATVEPGDEWIPDADEIEELRHEIAGDHVLHAWASCLTFIEGVVGQQTPRQVLAEDLPEAPTDEQTALDRDEILGIGRAVEICWNPEVILTEHLTKTFEQARSSAGLSPAAAKILQRLSRRQTGSAFSLDWNVGAEIAEMSADWDKLAGERTPLLVDRLWLDIDCSLRELHLIRGNGTDDIARLEREHTGDWTLTGLGRFAQINGSLKRKRYDLEAAVDLFLTQLRLKGADHAEG